MSGYSISLGVYTPAPPVLVAGNYSPFRLDSDSVLLVRAVSGGGADPVSRYNSAGDAASAVIKAAAGELLQITAFNNAAGVRYLHLFDAAALPINGTVPDWVAPPVAAQAAVSHFFGDMGIPFAVGIVAAISTTRTTLTVGGANMWFSARFR